MAKISVHRDVLEWQARHPTLTWILWGIVWAIVLSLLLAPHLQGDLEPQTNSASAQPIIEPHIS
jgi:hypothetical protein